MHGQMVHGRRRETRAESQRRSARRKPTIPPLPEPERRYSTVRRHASEITFRPLLPRAICGNRLASTVSTLPPRDLRSTCPPPDRQTPRRMERVAHAPGRNVASSGAALFDSSARDDWTWGGFRSQPRPKLGDSPAMLSRRPPYGAAMKRDWLVGWSAFIGFWWFALAAIFAEDACSFTACLTFSDLLVVPFLPAAIVW